MQRCPIALSEQSITKTRTREACRETRVSRKKVYARVSRNSNHIKDENSMKLHRTSVNRAIVCTKWSCSPLSVPEGGGGSTPTSHSWRGFDVGGARGCRPCYSTVLGSPTKLFVSQAPCTTKLGKASVHGTDVRDFGPDVTLLQVRPRKTFSRVLSGFQRTGELGP